MFGFNLADAIIIILLIGSVASGIKLGFSNQLFILGGFLGALFLAGALYPHLLPIPDRTIRTIFNTNLVLFTAFYAAARSFDLVQNLHWSFHTHKQSTRNRLERTDAWLGAVSAGAACLVVVWLVAAAIGRLPFAGVSNSANDARIVQHLTQALPPVPAVLAEFNRQVDPNSPPHVFVNPKPQTSFAYSPAEVQAATDKATAAVVRITGFGCGGIVMGSGFVAAPDLVVTNAHVIAGVRRPIIKYHGQSYEGLPVLFSPDLDFAILRVPGLGIKPLALASEDITTNTTVAVLGYPDGNFRVAPGLIRNNLTVFARNIYDVGVIGRAIYEIQASVAPGSSGGPVVLGNGQVAGVIFSKSLDVNDDAFALSSSHLLASLNKAKQSYNRVSTGVCLAS
ncbi:MAG: peptidase and chymotrypsin/Hap [Candidatus Saccharibacteria bacterium]|nr:peptidase and chymotrypsin/Hap [Candidatus Saccharibacteria bacterium]